MNSFSGQTPPPAARVDRPPLLWAALRLRPRRYAATTADVVCGVQVVLFVLQQAGMASVTEVYQCTVGTCSAMTRFPRYNDPKTLLRWRKGRYRWVPNVWTH